MSVVLSRRATLLGFLTTGASILSTGPTQLAFAADAAAEKQKIIADLVTANHILFHEGIVDAFGHVTARDPTNPTHYLMARSVSPPFVEAADIVELDADSKPVSKDPVDVPFERFIHGEIYRVRPDVQAVIHSHAADVLPFAIVKSVPLRAVCHTCGFLGSGAPVFEIRDVAGDSSNMLVQNIQSGAALARSLGNSAVVLMRGHGFTTVGASVREVVYNAINTVRDARIEMEALRLGDVTYLSQGEAAAVSKLHNASLDRSWEIWAKSAAGELR